MVTPGTSVYLLIGRDSYLREKAAKDLAESVVGGPSKDLDSKIFYGGESQPGEVLDQIGTVPFLSSKRFVIIKNLEEASVDFRSRLALYIKKPVHSTCLVLESADDSMLKEHPDIAGAMTVRRFDALTAGETASWIKGHLAGLGKKIAPDAVTLMREIHGQNFSSIALELDKLAAYTGSRPEVTASDIEEVSGRSLISSTFDLADAIGHRKAEDALRICRDLIVSGKKGYEIVGLLCWHLKRVLKAKTLQSKGESDSFIASTLGISQKYRSGFFRQVALLGLGQIRSRIRVLLEADLDIKRTRFDPNLVLEFAIIRLCQPA